MRCRYPFLKGLEEFGCRKCLPCRINRQRQLTIACVLEAGQHADNTFATLTYDDENYPESGSVSVRTAQLFLKRLRRAIGPLRYLIVGEYGERTWRAHYHALLFGVRDGRGVADSWPFGFVHISGVGPESIGYVTGYCLKGAVNESGMRWLNQAHLSPEFARWSRKPSLGALGADRIASFYTSKEGSALLARTGAPSTTVRHGQKMWALGRYLRARVVSQAGLDQDSLSRTRQLREQLARQSMSALDMEKFSELASLTRESEGHRAEERYRRKKLERRSL